MINYKKIFDLGYDKRRDRILRSSATDSRKLNACMRVWHRMMLRVSLIEFDAKI